MSARRRESDSMKRGKTKSRGGGFRAVSKIGQGRGGGWVGGWVACIGARVKCFVALPVRSYGGTLMPPSDPRTPQKLRRPKQKLVPGIK